MIDLRVFPLQLYLLPVSGNRVNLRRPTCGHRGSERIAIRKSYLREYYVCPPGILREYRWLRV